MHCLNRSGHIFADSDFIEAVLNPIDGCGLLKYAPRFFNLLIDLIVDFLQQIGK